MVSKLFIIINTKMEDKTTKTILIVRSKTITTTMIIKISKINITKRKLSTCAWYSNPS